MRRMLAGFSLLSGGALALIAWRAAPDFFPRFGSRFAYRDVLVGEGAPPAKGDRVTIVADITDLGSGRTLEQDKPITFQAGTGTVFPAVDQVMGRMRLGGRSWVRVPPELGVGLEDFVAYREAYRLDPDAVLLIEATLIEIVRAKR